MRAVIYLGVTLSLGCGGSTAPPVATQTPSSPPGTAATSDPPVTGTAALPPGALRHLERPENVVDGWEDLVAHASGVHRVRWSRENANGEWRYCAEVLETLLPRGTSSRGERICTLQTDMIGDPYAGHVPVQEPDHTAWIATEVVDEEVRLLTVGAHECREPPCNDVPKAAMVERLRCGQMERLWTHMPAAYRSCTQDSDCIVLTATCFEFAMGAQHAAPYRQAIQRFGSGRCLDPGAGDCESPEFAPRCQQGVCEAEFLN